MSKPVNEMTDAEALEEGAKSADYLMRTILAARLRQLAASLSAPPGMPSAESFARRYCMALPSDLAIAVTVRDRAYAAQVAALERERDALKVEVAALEELVRVSEQGRDETERERDELREEVDAWRRWARDWDAGKEHESDTQAMNAISSQVAQVPDLRAKWEGALAGVRSYSKQCGELATENARLRAEAASRLTGEAAQFEPTRKLEPHERSPRCDLQCAGGPCYETCAPAAAPPTGEAPAALTAAELAEAKRRAEKLFGSEVLKPAMEVATQVAIKLVKLGMLEGNCEREINAMAKAIEYDRSSRLNRVPWCSLCDGVGRHEGKACPACQGHGTIAPCLPEHLPASRPPAAPLRDACEVCHGARGGVPGNENIVDGKAMCDYCHAEASPPAAPPPVCRCDSGAHPRRCEVHPNRYAEHCAELSAENARAPASLLDQIRGTECPDCAVNSLRDSCGYDVEGSRYFHVARITAAERAATPKKETP